jgi:hypothetical protein
MFRRRHVARAIAVVVAALASAALPNVTGALYSGASAAGLTSLASQHNPIPIAPGRPLATAATSCGGTHRTPLPRPPVTAAPVLPSGPPAAPGLCPLQATEYDVVVSWYNRASSAQSFVVYRLDNNNNPQQVYTVAAYNGGAPGEPYSWTDTDTDQSAQCYMIAAVGPTGTGDSPVECTVRPDPRQFPQVAGTAGQTQAQWSGLSGQNDGTGPLVSDVSGVWPNNLIWSQNTLSLNPLSLHCGCGVDLAFSQAPSLWKVQAVAGPVIMYGEAVALRVWGGGWLEYAHQTFGVDLHLVSQPVYQWYILDGTAGAVVDSSADPSNFALWNSAANDYLVHFNETFGVDLQWEKKTIPPPSPPPPAASGGRILLYNCIMEDRPLEIWLIDDTAGTEWTDQGPLQPGWVDGDGCGENSDDSWTFTPVAGHTYEVRAVDFDADGCSNDPINGQCVRSDTTFLGNPSGPLVPVPIG